MAFKLNRKGVGLSGAERDKENENLTLIEQEFIRVGTSVPIADEAKKIADEARATALSSEAKSENVQQQLTNIVVEGDSSPQAAQASVSADGITYPSLKARLDSEQQAAAAKLKETENDLSKQKVTLNAGYYEGAVVSFVFDDGQVTDYTRFKPIFESEGVPGCANLITSKVGIDPKFMDWEQVKKLKQLGWTIASHTHTHPLIIELNENQIDLEYKTSHEILKEHKMDSDIIVYPYGSNNALSRRVARRYYKLGVDIVKPASNNRLPNLENFNLIRLPGLSQPISSTVTREPTLAECKAMVDEAITNKEYIVFEDHSHYAVYESSAKLEELRQLIQYIKSKGIPIVNLQDGYNMKCNPIDIGSKSESYYYKLHRNGAVSSSESVNNVSTIDSRFDTYTTLSHPDIFAPNKITYTRISNANTDIANFPNGQPGILITNRLYTNGFGYIFQEYHGYDGNHFKRRWTGTVWGSWVLLTINQSFTAVLQPETVVPANSQAEVELDFPDARSNRMIWGSPQSGIVANVMYNVFCTTSGKAKIRFFNLSASSVTLSQRSWYFGVKN